jgi:hypothetical protein
VRERLTATGEEPVASISLDFITEADAYIVGDTIYAVMNDATRRDPNQRYPLDGTWYRIGTVPTSLAR